MGIAHEINEEGVVSGAGCRVRMLAGKTPAHNLIFEPSETAAARRELSRPFIRSPRGTEA
ncbi:hypothetical protein [Ensifer sp. B1-9]|uniref:hypothetical protein n=1 Tax=Ensifer sp. B1-9 TaxID=3141455 RepID=UPI003D1CBAFA